MPFCSAAGASMAKSYTLRRQTRQLGIWDAYTGKRVRKLLGHTSHVNAVCAGGKRAAHPSWVIRRFLAAEMIAVYIFGTCELINASSACNIHTN